MMGNEQKITVGFWDFSSLGRPRRRISASGRSRPRTSCCSISLKAARLFGGINLKISSQTPLALKDDDALNSCVTGHPRTKPPV
jgi:hypothetical protein